MAATKHTPEPWSIEYMNDVGYNDDYFHKWWEVTDGNMVFTSDDEVHARWLLQRLNVLNSEGKA